MEERAGVSGWLLVVPPEAEEDEADEREGERSRSAAKRADMATV